MKHQNIAKSAIKFTSRHTAENFIFRAFETTGSSLRVVLGDDEKYWVVTPSEAEWLVKQGYNLG